MSTAKISRALEMAWAYASSGDSEETRLKGIVKEAQDALSSLHDAAWNASLDAAMKAIQERYDGDAWGPTPTGSELIEALNSLKRGQS